MHVFKVLPLIFIAACAGSVDAAESVARDETASSYFKFACRDPKLIGERPKTGLFRHAIPFTDGHGRSTVDFFNRVGKNILAAIGTEEKDLSLRRECMAGKTEDKARPRDCARSRSWLENELIPLVRAARMNLALAQTNENIVEESQYLRKNAATTVNETLQPLGTVKLAPWTSLTQEEAAKAAQILKEYQSESRAFADQEIAAGRLNSAELETTVGKSIYLAKLTHGRIYSELLARHPLLQYLQQPSTSKDEVAFALGKMQMHLKSDLSYVANSVRAANDKLTASRGRRDGVMPPEPRTSVNPVALQLLEYKTFVEDELLRQPADCGLALSLLETKENRELSTSLAIGVPLVVATIALPIIGEIVTGSVLATASGVGYAASAKADRDRATDRFLSKLNPRDQAEYLALDQANQDFELAVGLGVAGVAVGPAVRVGAKTVQFGTKLAAKSARQVFKSFKTPPGAR